MSVIQERLLSKIVFDNDNWCWQWKGAKDWQGYGLIIIKNKLFYTHRVIFEIFKFKIPEKMVIDHLYLNKSCLNPEHLECVTRAENTRRGTGFSSKNAQKTHCPRGHELTIDNIWKSDIKRGKRGCKKCSSIRDSLDKFKRSIVMEWES